jgi:deazaflavin-dependent oxidoreductase (nitroreductase family)
VHDTVDEQGRRALDLPRRNPALHVTADAFQDVGAGTGALECHGVEAELDGVTAQVVVLERLLTVVEQLVHVPEAALEGGRLRSDGRGEGVRVDIAQGEVPEGKADAFPELHLDPFDLAKGLARKRALVVAVLDDQTSGRTAADVVDSVVQRLHLTILGVIGGKRRSRAALLACFRMASADDELFGEEHVRVYRETGGERGYHWRGATILLLTTDGRVSGERRTTPLIHRTDGDRWIVVASKGGAPTNPGWYENLRANPDVTIQVLGEEIPVRASTAEGDERERLWSLMTEVWPDYDGYQTRTDREIPVVVLTRR